FPLLIKFIDASEALSIQVHPNDAYAQRVEHSLGKTEMWIVLECEPEAFLYYGVNEHLSPEAFQAHIENNTVESVLNRVPVKKGDVFYIEAGTIHAIGAGIVICEIQQNSDTTYRVYDFNRTDDRGNKRELHIQKAAEVSTLTPPTQSPGPVEKPVSIPGGSCQLLAQSPYFTVKSYTSTAMIKIPLSTDSFLALSCLDGDGLAIIDETRLPFKKGDSLFIPAQTATLTIEGACQLAATTV
ncbi:MAG: class I mannose-6-phosphate isomerase, partial [Eubacterium sp.]